MIGGKIRKEMSAQELDEYIKLQDKLRHALVMVNQYADNLIKFTREEIEATVNLNKWNEEVTCAGEMIMEYEQKMSEKYRGEEDAK